MEPPHPTLSDQELIDALRRAAGIWFKNTDLLLLEEFIKRYNYLKGVCHANIKGTSVE